eukprot:scaffold267_cov192-Amphora_coffeaeformis.AAC.15
MQDSSSSPLSSSSSSTSATMRGRWFLLAMLVAASCVVTPVSAVKNNYHNERDRVLRRSLRFATSVASATDESNGKAGKGKNGTDSGTGKTGKGKNGSKGSKGKGLNGSESQCVCNGVTEIKFLNPQQLVELGAARLSNIAGASIGDDALPEFFNSLTYALAHSLAPPNCHLAPVETEQDAARLAAVAMRLGMEGQPVGPGWVGVFKDLETAFEDQTSADVEVRREDWVNVDGSSVDPMVWTDGQPQQIMSHDTTLIEYVAVFNPFAPGLVSVPPTETTGPNVQGAYYECCAEVLPSCFESGLESLEDVLLPILLAGPPGGGEPGGGGEGEPPAPGRRA